MTTKASPRIHDTRITRAFEDAKSSGRTVIIPYVTDGFPELDDTQDLVKALIEGGADIVELGIPFSDPIADGPTIQRAGQRALDNGFTPEHAFATVAALREQGVDTPLIFMGYYNPVYAYGLDAYVAECARVGVDGLIVPDLPPEESDPLLEACINHKVHLIYLLAPTSTPERVEAVLQRANGFIYLVAATGITGARTELQAGLADYVARVRRHADLPLAIGFGISTRAHVLEAEKLADGIISGSALIDRLERASSDELLAEARDFIRSLRGS
jgi:tryptophan synthase alpha chain